eukprot:CAMPEP_0168769600 /NCGR_PEP_ID=MMETSP0725-20121227/2486_1 /TAXON_ID=265536 /ORGANISM="Amphiprora sp., Strain CCMP467" /LENGTH=337 /DNA_ID=CAMNT_0008819015 /DNA_START=100 /DNA_END=1113 /DNA_ORIENTATION=+
MKAFGNIEKGDSSKLLELDVPTPTPGPRDLVVRVKGISVNPVDYKVCEWFDAEDSTIGRVLGWDAAGVVEQVGDEVKDFAVGDQVFYAGEFTKPGTNAELQCVDERIAGKKPDSMDFAEAAGFPLTSITAWELLFDSLAVKEGEGEGDSILVLGAAGGVGSILIQLIKKLTKFSVIATASRPETIEWVKKMGSDHVVNHRNPLPAQVKDLGLQPKYVICLNGTEGHIEGIIELIQARGRIAIIDDPTSLDLTKYATFKLKALTFSWEFMFARSMFQTSDMIAQQKLLNRVSEMIDSGDIISIVTGNLGKLSLDTLKKAHESQASGRAVGKSVLDVEL